MKTQDHSGFALNYVGQRNELLQRVRTSTHNDRKDKYISTNGPQQEPSLLPQLTRSQSDDVFFDETTQHNTTNA